MKLLFDQNVSPKLVSRLADVFPESMHVATAGLDRAPDAQIWEHAKTHGFAIVSKDEDFDALSIQHGLPPKVVWLQLGNCTTSEIESAFRSRLSELEVFEKDATLGIIVLT